MFSAFLWARITSKYCPWTTFLSEYKFLENFPVSYPKGKNKIIYQSNLPVCWSAFLNSLSLEPGSFWFIQEKTQTQAYSFLHFKLWYSLQSGQKLSNEPCFCSKQKEKLSPPNIPNPVQAQAWAWAIHLLHKHPSYKGILRQPVDGWFSLNRMLTSWKRNANPKWHRFAFSSFVFKHSLLL